MDSRNTDRQAKIRSILEDLSEEERRLLSGVLEAERDKLHMERPRFINDELWKVLTEVIR